MHVCVFCSVVWVVFEIELCLRAATVCLQNVKCVQTILYISALCMLRWIYSKGQSPCALPSVTRFLTLIQLPRNANSKSQGITWTNACSSVTRGDVMFDHVFPQKKPLFRFYFFFLLSSILFVCFREILKGKFTLKRSSILFCYAHCQSCQASVILAPEVNLSNTMELNYFW